MGGGAKARPVVLGARQLDVALGSSAVVAPAHGGVWTATVRPAGSLRPGILTRFLVPQVLNAFIIAKVCPARDANAHILA